MNENSELLKSFVRSASKEDLKNILWLQENPHYEEKPVEIEEFCLSPDYLNLGKSMRPNILDELKKIFPSIPKDGKVSHYIEVVFMCGIGWGKTFSSALMLDYMIYLTLCLKDPQDYYGLAPGTPIHFMLMSNSERQARDVIFTNMKALVDNSPWFQIKNRAYDPNVQTQLNFPKKIFLIPGNSQETFFEGYNILGGIIDEADAHKKTVEKDYAEEGYRAITRRIVSRFQDKGVVIIIGSPKTTDGFLMTRYKSGKKDDNAYTQSVPTWHSLAGTGKLSGDSFLFKHPMIREYMGEETSGEIEIPIEYKREFDENPEKALRDLAAIPFYAVSPFFTMPDNVKNYKITCPVPYDEYNRLNDDFKDITGDPHWIHIDLATKHDSVGFALGKIVSFKEFEGDLKPIVKLPMIMRIQAPIGGEIVFGDVRKIIYNLIDRGFNIKKVTFDGWQSVEMLQQLKKRGIHAEILSVDKTTAPYEDLKDCLYENRFRSHEMEKFVDECLKLEYIDGKKIDHPPKGSKDVSDAVAGCVHNIMTSQEARSGSQVMSAPQFFGERIF